MVEKRINSLRSNLKHKLKQMERLMDIDLTLASKPELDQVLDLIILKAVEMLECEAGSILL